MAATLYTKDKIDQLIANTNWQTITPASGWSNFTSAPYGQPRYRLKNGFVTCQGMMFRPSGTNTAMFTLPVGFRPSQQLIVAACGADAFAELIVATTGVVTFGAGNASSWVSLNNIMFSVD